MFYIEVEDKQHLIVVPEKTNRSIEVDDDIKNYHLYFYDAQENVIVKRHVINYELSADGDAAVIAFDTGNNLMVNVDFSNDINGQGVYAGRLIMLESIEGKATLTLSSALTGSIYIASGDNSSYFEPLVIDSDTGLDNEYNPAIYIEGNELRIEQSIDYSRFRSLQKDIETLRKDFDELRLVVQP